jgi:hypothetical protein
MAQQDEREVTHTGDAKQITGTIPIMSCPVCGKRYKRGQKHDEHGSYAYYTMCNCVEDVTSFTLHQIRAILQERIDEHVKSMDAAGEEKAVAEAQGIMEIVNHETDIIRRDHALIGEVMNIARAFGIDVSTLDTRDREHGDE